jgi:queuine tRNA-ribosyltransferase
MSMARPIFFKTKYGKISLPVFFPDATRAVVRTLDSVDILNTKTPGILVNTLHLYNKYGKEVIQKMGGVREFMNFRGGVISDSGGFQVGSLVKKNPGLGKVTEKGVVFRMQGETPSPKGKRIVLTPEDSMKLQMDLEVDMVVALDDFDAPGASFRETEESVERTILWAKRSKDEYTKICRKRHLSGERKPYILGVVQGGRYKRLRRHCVRELVKIGFDGIGYGGEEKVKGNINLGLARYIAALIPKDYFLYALGVGKPHDVVNMSKIGWNIFDCVLPTRDARHGRLYVFKAGSMDKIDISKKDFYETYFPDKMVNLDDSGPISRACDCTLCRNYSRAYLAYLFKIKEVTALRLSTLHNLRFYSLLVEKIREKR